MNLRHLEILEAVAQTGTFTGAAQKLYLTQSAVSHAVAELERQAGTALFDRLPRGVRLTPGGALLLEVKFDAFLPEVIQKAVQLDSRRAAAFSKYAACRVYG